MNLPNKPNRPGQIYLDDLILMGSGTRLILHHSGSMQSHAHEEKVVYLGLGEKGRFMVRGEFGNTAQHFTDHGLAPYGNGWNPVNWITRDTGPSKQELAIKKVEQRILDSQTELNAIRKELREVKRLS